MTCQLPPAERWGDALDQDLYDRLVQYAARLNIKVEPHDLDRHGLMIRFWDGERIIMLNQNDSLAERIFTIAHELGHFEYKHLYEGWWDDERPPPDPEHERLADEYACDFLNLAVAGPLPDRVIVPVPTAGWRLDSEEGLVPWWNQL